MTNWIQKVCEPKRLVLAWQAPDHMGDRFRWAVGEITSGETYRLRYFDSRDEFSQLNAGREYAELTALGYRGYPAFDPEVRLHEANVLGPFLRRLPPRSRSDFDEYRRNFRLGTNTSASDFALLGLTEAKLPNDGFSLVNPLDGDLPECELFLEVAGFRYYEKNVPLTDCLGEQVRFRPEPNNPKDPNAVQVLMRDVLMGYINRLQASSFLRWIAEERVSGVLERLNGTPDKPRAFVFIRVNPKPNKQAA